MMPPIISAHGVPLHGIEHTQVPKEVQQAWQSYTDIVVRYFNIVDVDGKFEWRLIDATEAGEVEEGDLGQHQDGDQSGEATEASGGDSSERRRQSTPEEVGRCAVCATEVVLETMTTSRGEMVYYRHVDISYQHPVNFYKYLENNEE
jgi:hypothetical protein